MPDYYNTAEQLNQYLVFHYGTDADILKWDFGPKQALGFHKRLANCVDLDRLPDRSRALDLGCSVGRITFELARHVDSVVGIDFSHQFIAAATEIQKTASVELYLTREGELSDKVSRSFGEDLDAAKIQFSQGNAENLPGNIGTFDVVILANILDRLPHPRDCLKKLSHLLNPGGQLIICSPFTWWDEFTNRKERLGGYMENEKEVTSLDSMKLVLSEHFDLQDVQDQPFLIREHERKYHFSVAETSIWIRKQ
ncbi:MAG: putative 4-mercaptohistidine N1-methyltransferase [Parasphingorhabdus sp.]|jgi:putative 4-mercaptohistidine N1-methyltranferase